MATRKRTSAAASASINPPWKATLDALSSVRLTLANLGLAMILIAAGTLAQVRMGTFEAQKVFFNSWWVSIYAGGFKIPVFPGGLTVGLLWLINLIAAFITRFKFSRKDLGLFVTHAGLILLLLGQFLTQWFSRESQLPLAVGESSNYSESLRSTELAVIKTSDPDFDVVTSIPESRFSHEGEIHPSHLPFYLVIHRFFSNAQLSMAGAGVVSLANQGIGTRIAVNDVPRAANDEPNNVSAFVEIRQKDQSLGIWLVSAGLGAPQSFNVDGGEYQLTIRPQRYYFPFTLTLKEFHHDIYPGTDIPKNFASSVLLSHPEKNESRQSLIYMNHPLRYEGRTFYQASFGEGDRVSVFQVVENPAALTPYLGCSIVILGLLIQFLSHLLAFAKKRK